MTMELVFVTHVSLCPQSWLRDQAVELLAGSVSFIPPILLDL